MLAGAPEDATGDTIALIGNRIRDLRKMRSMPLRALAESTGISMSMLSLVERGKTSPSIGTLIAICSALEVHMSDLLAPHAVKVDPVSRVAEQAVFRTTEGVQRRILWDDRLNGVEIAINEYAPATGSAPAPLRHAAQARRVQGPKYSRLVRSRSAVTVQASRRHSRRLLS